MTVLLKSAGGAGVGLVVGLGRVSVLQGDCLCVPFTSEVGTLNWECHHTRVDRIPVTSQKTNAIPVVVVTRCYQYQLITTHNVVFCAYKHHSNICPQIEVGQYGEYD